MLRFDITNRFTGAVQFTAEIDCGESKTQPVKLGLAVKWAVKNRAYLCGAYLGGAYLRGADLRGAYLGGADMSGAYLGGADMSGADMRGADMRGAYLRGAYLGGAYLRGADLRGADMRGAYLGGAYLCGAYLGGAYLGDQWIIQGATRSDGHQFFLQKLKDDTEPMVKAGCRYFTIARAQEHWETTRKGQKLLDETRAIIRCMVDIAYIRGFMKRPAEQAVE